MLPATWYCMKHTCFAYQPSHMQVSLLFFCTSYSNCTSLAQHSRICNVLDQDDTIHSRRGARHGSSCRPRRSRKSWKTPWHQTRYRASSSAKQRSRRSIELDTEEEVLVIGNGVGVHSRRWYPHNTALLRHRRHHQRHWHIDSRLGARQWSHVLVSGLGLSVLAGYCDWIWQERHIPGLSLVHGADHGVDSTLDLSWNMVCSSSHHWDLLCAHRSFAGNLHLGCLLRTRQRNLDVNVRLDIVWIELHCSIDRWLDG